MPRPRRTPRPPGNVQVLCTGRGTHDPEPVRRLQLRTEGDRVRLFWDQREGPAPETGFRREDGWKTFEFQCRACPRHLKRGEEWLVQRLLALAVQRGITGDSNAVIELDISAIERA